jgi:hypothetical protein
MEILQVSAMPVILQPQMLQTCRVSVISCFCLSLGSPFTLLYRDYHGFKPAPKLKLEDYRRLLDLVALLLHQFPLTTLDLRTFPRWPNTNSLLALLRL